MRNYIISFLLGAVVAGTVTIYYCGNRYESISASQMQQIEQLSTIITTYQEKLETIKRHTREVYDPETGKLIIKEYCEIESKKESSGKIEDSKSEVKSTTYNHLLQIGLLYYEERMYQLTYMRRLLGPISVGSTVIIDSDYGKWGLGVTLGLTF